MKSQFHVLGLPVHLSQVVDELGFTELTAIQAQAIPLLLAGRDLIGQSQTGSGKTVAFALPLLASLGELQGAAATPRALVLCPTRELSAQVTRTLRQLGRRLPGLRVLALAGGEPVRAQLAALARSAHVVVGTPGRVLDHLRRGSLQLQDVATLVLDEADRMLDMGFQEDMAQILAHAPAERQTVFFSATFGRSIEALSAQYQRDAARVTVASEGPAPGITHLYAAVKQPDKLALLCSAPQLQAAGSALVFVTLKASVPLVARALCDAGQRADGLHGDMLQPERDLALAKFRNGSTRVLVATDVAARGIDVESLALVVNYDLPTRFDVYVHRVGRTGRAGKPGAALSLVTEREIPRIAALEQALGIRFEPVTLQALPLMASETRAPETAEPAMQTLRIAAGRKQKLRPADILGALTGEAAGLEGSQIGKIEIHDHFSYVAVAKRVSRAAQRGLSAGRIKGRRFQVALLD